MGNVVRLWIILLLFFSSFKICLKSSCNRFLEVHSITAFTIAMMNCHNLAITCLYKAKPSWQKLINGSLLISACLDLLYYMIMIIRCIYFISSSLDSLKTLPSSWMWLTTMQYWVAEIVLNSPTIYMTDIMQNYPSILVNSYHQYTLTWVAGDFNICWYSNILLCITIKILLLNSIMIET